MLHIVLFYIETMELWLREYYQLLFSSPLFTAITAKLSPMAVKSAAKISISSVLNFSASKIAIIEASTTRCAPEL